jgi:hypothetical protein
MFLDPGTVCDDVVACTGNDFCQNDGSCAGTPSAVFCSIGSGEGSVCAPADEQADADGCVAP